MCVQSVLGRSPTIFESIAVSTVTAVDEEEEEANMDVSSEAPPEADAIDDAADEPFEMDV